MKLSFAFVFVLASLCRQAFAGSSSYSTSSESLPSSTAAVRVFNIECEFDTRTYYISGELYVCVSYKITTSLNQSSISFSGTHLDGKSNADVKSLAILDENLDFFPRGLSQLFPNIEVLTIENAQIEVLNGDELREFPKLAEFQMVYTTLTTVGGGLFEPTPNLATVYMGYNKINRVGSGLFAHDFPNLKVLSFRGNTCIDVPANFKPYGYTRAELQEVITALQNQCPSEGRPRTLIRHQETPESGVRETNVKE